jgi:hypothetical protein
MHGGNQPLTLLFCDGDGDIEGKGELFSIFLPGFISGTTAIAIPDPVREE